MQLKNGLTLLLKEDHSQPVATVQVWVNVGSVNETEKTSGLSHFLEHLIFKGSASYPGNQISEIVETQGGMINAATSKEFTYFYIDTQKNGVDDAIRILADAMENAVFPAAEIEKERPVVLEEIMRHEDTPQAILYDIFTDALFLKTPYNKRVLGSEDVIRNVSRAEINDYYKTFYSPKNMFVVIVGDIEPVHVTDLVKSTFGKQKNVSSQPAEIGRIEPLHEIKTIKQNKNVEQTHFLAGFLGPDLSSDEQYTADIVGTLLGGGRSSRFYKNIREQKQLVYTISASFWSQKGTGAMVVSAVFAKENESQVLTEINNEIKKLRDTGPDEEELQRAKTIITSQWHFGNETFHDKASLLGYWHLQGNPKVIDTYLSKIRGVTGKDIQRFLRTYYDAQGLSTAIIAPENSEQ